MRRGLLLLEPNNTTVLGGSSPYLGADYSSNMDRIHKKLLSLRSCPNDTVRQQPTATVRQQPTATVKPKSSTVTQNQLPENRLNVSNSSNQVICINDDIGDVFEDIPEHLWNLGEHDVSQFTSSHERPATTTKQTDQIIYKLDDDDDFEEAPQYKRVVTLSDLPSTTTKVEVCNAHVVSWDKLAVEKKKFALNVLLGDKTGEHHAFLDPTVVELRLGMDPKTMKTLTSSDKNAALVKMKAFYEWLGELKGDFIVDRRGSQSFEFRPS